MNDKTHRACLVCGRAFPRSGRKITCSPKCARARMLTQIDAARRARRGQLRVFPCAVCGEEVRTRRWNKAYCESENCKTIGLARAIRRQAERREAARKTRAAAAT